MVFLEFMAHFTSLSHSIYNLDLCETVARCHFSNQQFFSSLSPPPPPPQVLFHRPFKGSASVVVPRQNLFIGDPSLISTTFCSDQPKFIFKCLYYNSSVCPIHLFQQRYLSCHLFGKELLTRLIICNSVAC